MKKMLILGAAGFIGNNLLDYFYGKYDITTVEHNKQSYAKGRNYKRIIADLTDKTWVENIFSWESYNVVLQFAATTSNAKDTVGNPSLHVTDNAIINSLVFRAACQSGVEHIFFPSCTTMYPSSKAAAKESDYYREGIYKKYFGVASTKVYIEDMCKFWSQISPTKFSVLRHSNIYGPYDRFNLKTGHVFSATIRKVLDATDTVDILGNGTEIRNLLHVHDLCTAIKLMLDGQNEPFKLYNLGGDDNLSILDITEMIIRASGKNLSINLQPDKQLTKFDMPVNSDAFRKEFAWIPSISIQEGIDKTLEWVKNNGYGD